MAGWHSGRRYLSARGGERDARVEARRGGLRGTEVRREPPRPPLRRRSSRAMRHAGSRAAAGILARSFPGAAAVSVCGAEAGTQKSGCGCPPGPAPRGGERPRRCQHGKERGRGTERGVAAAAAPRGAGMPGGTERSRAAASCPPWGRRSPPPAPLPPASAERGHGGALRALGSGAGRCGTARLGSAPHGTARLGTPAMSTGARRAARGAGSERGEGSPRAMQHRREFVSDFVPPVWQRDHTFGSAFFFLFFSPLPFHLSGGKKRLNWEFFIFLGMNSMRHDSVLRFPLFWAALGFFSFVLP